MQDFRQLRVWHLAKLFPAELTRALTPRACRALPGFRSQILRAALSISANIAEGCGKRSRDEFRRYLETSLGSLLEVESDLEVAVSAAVVRSETHANLTLKTKMLRRMLISLIGAVDAEIANPDARARHRSGT